tara:strand:+ start:7219 stop:7410 length:192 start_codon:yes stop_codon:yes gene_type:complete
MIFNWLYDSKYEYNKELAKEIIDNIDKKIKELSKKGDKLCSEDYDYIEKKTIIISSLKYFYSL